MANGQFIIPESYGNEVLAPLEAQEIDPTTLKRVDQIVDNYPLFAVSQALENAVKQNTSDAFDQMLAANPELLELIYDVAQGVGVDAELYRASAKPDVLKSSMKERAFGVLLQKPPLEARLVNAESELGGKMFGDE